MDVPKSLSIPSQVIRDNKLGVTKQEELVGPRVLMVTTCRWFSAARLVMAFARTGCKVDAVCPGGHPVIGTRALHHWYPLNLLHPVPSLRTAILDAEPEFIFPCDDLAAIELHRLYERGSEYSSDSVLRLLERSLGDPQSFPVLESRSRFLEIAREEGIPTPETTVVSSIADVEQWCQQHALPAVLKADGTSGGEGVRFAESLQEARRAYAALRAPLGTAAVAKRTTLDRDLNLLIPWILRRNRTVSIQAFVEGHDTNIAVACWDGKVLATIGADVVRTAKAKGPAAVVRVIDDPQMLLAATKLAKRLRLSGFCGLDFMVDDRTGVASLIEINARATQTCHLPLGCGHDLPASLISAFHGGTARSCTSVTRCDTIALFPLAWQHDPTGDYIRDTYHDVPWEEPTLVRAGMAPESPFTYENFLRLWSRVHLRRRTAPREKAHEI
jgi:glutathione synthase/RimK-type ligase-like ATP-grasp enzyme